MPAVQAFPPMSGSLVEPQTDGRFVSGSTAGPASMRMVTGDSMMQSVGSFGDVKTFPGGVTPLPPPSTPSVVSNTMLPPSNLQTGPMLQPGTMAASSGMTTNISVTGFPYFSQAAIDGRTLSNNEVLSLPKTQPVSTGQPMPAYQSQPFSMPVSQPFASQPPVGSIVSPPSPVYQSQPMSADPFLPARAAPIVQAAPYVQAAPHEENGVLDVFVDEDFSPIQAAIDNILPEDLRFPDVSVLVDQEKLNDIINRVDAQALSSLKRPGGRMEGAAPSGYSEAGSELQPGFWMKVQGDDCQSRRVEPHWFDGKWWLVAPTDLKGVKKPYTLGGRNYQGDGVEAALQEMEDRGQMPYLPRHYHAGKECPIS